jgi:hypothetical protein
VNATTSANVRHLRSVETSATARMYNAESRSARGYGMMRVMAEQSIRELTATVKVLTKMLIDAGVVDEQVLRARIEASLDEEMHETNKIVECTGCQKRVPVTRAQHTAAGYVCDECTGQ